MRHLDSEELGKLSAPDLVKRLNDLRSELVTMRSKAARGVLKKELGEIKTLRRNIARVLTVMNSVPKEKIGNKEKSSGKNKKQNELAGSDEKGSSSAA